MSPLARFRVALAGTVALVGALSPTAATPATARVAAATAAGSDPSPARLWRPDALRQRPQVGAPVQARLVAGTPVELLASRPGWWQVRSDRGTGWVRMFSVQRTVAAVPGGVPAAPSRGAVPAAAALASSHALLLGVGQFAPAAVPPLPGVAHDMVSARRLALSMGVPEHQITEARDAALTLDGVVAQVQGLVERVRPGDRVFVYWSGHGTRYRDTGRPGAPCVTSLLAHDGQPFTDSMLAEALGLLAERTDKLFVFIDACFSGGAVAPSRGTGPQPRFFARSGPDAACGVPSNQVTRSLQATGPGRWAARDNLVYLSAARDTEIAFEDGASGGFATRAWRDCALGEARDLDGSGQASVAEITACAQLRVDQWLAGQRDFLPHHLTLLGNRDFVPRLAPPALLPVPAPSAQPAPPVPPAAPAPAVAPAPAAPIAAPAPPASPEALLRDILAQRDDRRQVRLQPARETLRVGHDELALTVTSSHPGFLYLLYVGSDGRSVDMLFPNQLDQDNFIPARRPVQLPRAGWRIEARGPVGLNHLLAIVSDAPRDFSGLGWQPAGVFSSLQATGDGLRTLARQAGEPAPAVQAGCRGELPAAVPGQPCGSAFGAALLTVRELP